MRNFGKRGWLAVAVLLTLAGCSKTTTAPNSADSSTGSSAANSNADTNGSSSQPMNSAANQQQAPQPPPPVVVPAGTILTVTLGETIDSKTSSSGDPFHASLAVPVSVEGQEVIPSGTTVTGTVTDAKSAGRFKGGAELALTLDSLTLNGRKYQIVSTSFEEAGKGRGKRTAVGAGGGAAFGAIVGALAGGGKGAAIGALAGGGAGTAGAAFTGKRDFALPAETRLHFKLTQALTIQP